MKRNKEVDPSAEWPEPIDLLRSFAPVHPKEVYTYRPTLNPSLLFDISKAWRLIDGWTPAERVARFSWRTLSDHDLDTHQIDTDQAKHADLGIPVVWATVEEPNPRTGLPYTWTRMIDGYHRAYKAYQMKRRLHLPSFVLTTGESMACRIVAAAPSRKSAGTARGRSKPCS